MYHLFLGYYTYLWIVLYACEHKRMRFRRVRVQERVELVPTVADMGLDLCWLTFIFPQLLSMRTSISSVPGILYVSQKSSICVWTYPHAFPSCDIARESWTCSYCCGHGFGPVLINLHFPPTSKHAHKYITCSWNTIRISEKFYMRANIYACVPVVWECKRELNLFLLLRTCVWTSVD